MLQKDLSNTSSISTSSAKTQLISLVLSLIGFFIAVAGGLLVWELSPFVTNTTEPWDSIFPYYLLGISFVSGIGSLFTGRHFWLPVLGTYIGQVVYCMSLPAVVGPVILPITVSTALFGIPPSLLGIVIASVIKREWSSK